MRGAQALHVAGIGLLDKLHGAPLARLFAKARQMGLRTSLDLVDPGPLQPAEAWPYIKEALDGKLVDLLSISMAEAIDFVGLDGPRAVACQLAPLVRVAVFVKMDKEGMLVLAHGASEPTHIPIFPVTAKNGTGSGDGAAAAALLLWLSMNCPGEMTCLELIALFASAVGALIVRQGIGTKGIGSPEDLLAFIGDYDK